jgi:hypothetical protein
MRALGEGKKVTVCYKKKGNGFCIGQHRREVCHALFIEPIRNVCVNNPKGIQGDWELRVGLFFSFWVCGPFCVEQAHEAIIGASKSAPSFTPWRVHEKSHRCPTQP